MDPNKWLPKLPLFGAQMCVYCGGVADSRDHTPPQCFLPQTLPSNVQAMSIPACKICNNKFSNDETKAAAVICAVSLTKTDREAVAKGGWVYSALKRDKALSQFINSRLGADGMFLLDDEVFEVLIRIAKKTATGLLFYEFGRIIHPDKLKIVAMEHTKNVHPSALVETHRRTDGLFAEVTLSGRELERQVMALCGLAPRHMCHWKVYVREFFEFIFIKRSNSKMLCAMKFHDALTILLESSWPSDAGPRRVGKPRIRKKVL